MSASSPVRIAYDGAIYNSTREGGISRYYTHLIEQLAILSPTWQFDIHVAETGSTLCLPEADNIAVYGRGHLKSRLCSPLNYLNLRKRISRTNPQVIHATLGRPFPWQKCPTVTTIHDLIQHRVSQYYGDRRYNRARRLWERSARSSSGVITVSETSKQDILEILGADPAKVFVTHPGVNRHMRPSSTEEIDAYRSERQLWRPYILYVGHRGEHKNFALLAKAFADSGGLRDFDLVVVGGEDEIADKELLKLAIQRRLHHWRGVGDQELRLIYGAAAALVFPSIYEGFGFPLVEAMACGTPIAASDIPSTREVCAGACVFFDLGDPADCSAAILRATERTTGRQLARRGLARASEFTWEECARKTKKVYESLL
jgi:glycosyltransferase involved in cell wall biosynthesis